MIGKTVLASLIIDECLQSSFKTVWFYCKYGDNQRNTFVALAKALIAQLLEYDKHLLPYIYNKMCGRSEPILSTERLAKELLETALKDSTEIRIIIDGLDECDPKETKKIIEFLRSIANCSHNNQGFLQCVFVSQSNAIAVKNLQDIPTIEIQPSDNHDDIVRFLSSRGADIRNKFRISEEIVQQMNGLVASRAGGNNHLVDAWIE
jgi:hypothetical protein